MVPKEALKRSNDDGRVVLGGEDLIDKLTLILGSPRRPDPRPVDLDLPPEGITIDELPEHWSVTMAEALVRIGRLELEGRVRRDGELILPL